MSKTQNHPTLSAAAASHLANMYDIESKRRDIDGGLRSPVIDGREALLDAASNLECGQPQSQPEIARRLRAAADLLVEMDIECTELVGLQSALRHVRGPQLRQLAVRVRTMAHDDADLVANSLLNIADGWTE